MRRIAVIDLGTNTFHLLITELNDGLKVIPGNIFKETIPVKLGEGGITKGIISPEAYLRGIQAVEKFAGLISDYQVTEVHAVATAALRSAANGSQFISEVKERTGIEITLIDGDKEALLIYKGVREAVEIKDEPALIMDIGGGSVELILCDSSQVFLRKSYPLGAARLMEQFHHSDPVSQEDQAKVNLHLEESLTEFFDVLEKYKPDLLIGSAGAFETFAELIKKRFNQDENRSSLPFREINLSQFKKIAEVLIRSTHQERVEMPGLIPLRVDMIIVATILTEFIIKRAGIKKMVLSDYSLKEGVLFDLIS